jgi:post-segregation antitoxin (ccd killing protein)
MALKLGPIASREAREARKVRATLYVPADLLEEARDAAVFLAGYPVRLTLSRLVEDAFRAELRRLKNEHNAGQDFPQRTEALRGGRPIAA